MDSLEQRRILRMPEVTKLVGLSRATIYAMVASGDFPPPLRLGNRSSGWRLVDVDAWLASSDRLWLPSGRSPRA